MIDVAELGCICAPSHCTELVTKNNCVKHQLEPETMQAQLDPPKRFEAFVRMGYAFPDSEVQLLWLMLPWLRTKTELPPLSTPPAPAVITASAQAP